MKSVLLILLLLVANYAGACISPVDSHTKFNVNQPGKVTIAANTEDLVVLNMTYPLVPGLGNNLQVAYDESVLREVAVVPGMQEFINPPMGVQGNFLYLKAVGAGDTTVNVKLPNGKSFSQTVVVKERPRKRCL